MATGSRCKLGECSRAWVAAWVLPVALGCTAARPTSSDDGPTASPPGPALSGLHRLNTAEYNATVKDVLGTKLQPATTGWRGGEIGGFDNIASQLGVDEAQYDRYYRAAHALAVDVMSTPELRARFVSCDLSRPDCVDESLRGAGLRLFRRPLDSDELESYRRVYTSALALDDDASSAFELALESLLASVQFLYRIELDPRPDSAEPRPLDGYELASRLSYFLWSSAPDEALLQQAADGSLLRVDGLSAAVDGMLDDDAELPTDATKSWRFVANFAGQWLGEREVPTHASPAWSSREAQAAGLEMLYFFNDFLRSDASWREFPTADFNYVNGELPYLYGMPLPGVFGDPPPEDWMSIQQFHRVRDVDDERAGFFGLAGFLALTSFDRRTSPSKRGKWIAGNLLCAEPPPPMQVLPTLESDAQGESGLSTLDVRRRLEEHRKNPACAACHALFDPYGLALEHFDPIGRYRATYDDGSPLDVSAQLPASDAYPDGVTVSGLAELSQRIAADPRFTSCLAQKLFTYGLGRIVTDADEPLLQDVRESWLADGETPSVRRLIHALVSSRAFRFRRGGG